MFHYRLRANRVGRCLATFAFGVALACVPTRDVRAEVSSSSGGEFLVGMEIELQPELLKNLVHLFDWDVIESRWRETRTTLESKYAWGLLAEPDSPYRSELPLRQQNSEFLARLAIRLAGYASDGVKNLPARNDLTAEEARILKGLMWDRDSGKLEFAHQTPFADPQAYLNHLATFSRAAKIEEPMNHPIQPGLPELSYHIHFSVPGKRSVQPTLARFNRLMLMRLIEAGLADELFTGRRMSRYSEDLEERGIVRIFEANHFELRRHVLAPEEELNDLRRLFLATEETAEREMAGEFLALASEKNLTKLLALIPAYALIMVTQSLTEASPSASQAALARPELVATVKKLGGDFLIVRKYPERFSESQLQLIQSRFDTVPEVLLSAGNTPSCLRRMGNIVP